MPVVTGKASGSPSKGQSGAIRARPARPLIFLYIYIGMHPAPLRQDGFYIYIYRNAPSSRPCLRYVRNRQAGTTYVNVTFVAAPPPRSPRPHRRHCRASRTEAFPQSPLLAPKTKAASARSAEKARAAGARTFFFNRHSETKRGVFVTPPL